MRADLRLFFPEKPDRRSSYRSRRTARGASIILFVTALGLMVIPLLSAFAFDTSRAVLATQMLKNATDAAALAAVATLASGDIKDPALAQANAKKVALNLFKQNTVLGQLLTDSTIAATKNGDPAALHSELFFEFLDPVTKKVLPEGDPQGKVVRLTVSYGMIPAFGKFLGMGRHVIRTASHGAVPQLDVVICFDISGSIDDETKITLIKRQWDSVLNKIVYKTPSTSTVTHGTIRAICTPPATGTSFNAAYPMGLSSVGGGMEFSEWYAWSQEGKNAKGMRSNDVYPEGGCPPGNYSGALSYDSKTGLFTDLVVNLDNNDTFTTFTTTDGFQFPDVATMVEASRGNLETDALKTASKADTSVTVAAKNGYQAAYFKEAMLHLQPIQDAKDAVSIFCQIINNNADAHFGLVSFDHMVGSSPTTTESRINLDDADSRTNYGARIDVPVPMIALDKTDNVTHYNEVLNALPPTVAKGSTNIGLAVKTAVDQIKANGRTNAVKAVILFTDGQPTAGQPLDGDPSTNARKAAVYAQQNGVPVYTIGLAINSALIPGQTAILNDTDSNPNSGGIAAISGQGAIFHQVTDSKKLREAFQKVARHLVQLVQEQYNE